MGKKKQREQRKNAHEQDDKKKQPRATHSDGRPGSKVNKQNTLHPIAGWEKLTALSSTIPPPPPYQNWETINSTIILRFVRHYHPPPLGPPVTIAHILFRNAKMTDAVGGDGGAVSPKSYHVRGGRSSSNPGGKRHHSSPFRHSSSRARNVANARGNTGRANSFRYHLPCPSHIPCPSTPPDPT